MGLRLDSSIQYLKGVGPKLGSLFERQGLRTIQDLIEFYPRTYEDRRAARNIASLKPDEVVSLKATVVTVSSFSLGRSTQKMTDVLIRDSSGQIHCKFFRVPYRGYFERLKSGKEVRLVGKVTNYRGRLEFHHPDLKDIVEGEEIEDALIPIYIEIEGLSSFKIQRLIQSAIAQVKDQIIEILPSSVIQENQLVNKLSALTSIHQPQVELAADYFSMKSPAHQRLIFEEFFWLELFLAARKSGFKSEQAPVIVRSSEQMQMDLKKVPFSLTGAQQRVLQEVAQDLSSGRPMHRLVQGDVGSGKTIVALLSAWMAIENKYQVTLMAPTEILAEQHLKNAQKIFSAGEVRMALLSGRTKAAEKKKILEQLAQGEIDLLIGTHALIEDPVQFQKLGLVIVDEQHRFGVEQRAKLKHKGNSPHFLVMTATPIPRTLAMTVYGDLDVSIIDELPPGRSPIQTRVVFDSKKRQVLDFMAEQVQKGRQVYIVYPLVEESEKMDLKNAVEEFEKLKTQCPQIKFDLLHGRMKSEEKDLVMDRFRKHETQVLVSTTVIEVGVDVPNANMMIIEHAERFGLSQLHQLRGRVGRGEHKSFCILVLGYAVSEEARLRTEFMEKTTDGFKIAEFDLEMRGPGEFMGRRQSGLAGFKMANLVRDTAYLHKARQAAFEILQKDPQLLLPAHAPLREELLKTHGATALAGIA